MKQLKIFCSKSYGYKERFDNYYTLICSMISSNKINSQSFIGSKITDWICPITVLMERESIPLQNICE